MTGSAEDAPPFDTPDPGRRGPDLYTMRAWVELEQAIEAGAVLDAAHAVITDALSAAGGPRVFEWAMRAVAAEGGDPEAPGGMAGVLTDDALAARVLAFVHARMGEDDEAPDPPDDGYHWSAFPPDDPAGGRAAFRRAVRGRARALRWAALAPPRRRVAGARGRGRW